MAVLRPSTWRPPRWWGRWVWGRRGRRWVCRRGRGLIVVGLLTGVLVGGNAGWAAAAGMPAPPAGPVAVEPVGVFGPVAGPPASGGPYAPIEVNPNWENMPGKDKVGQLLNVLAEVGFAGCVAIFVAGGAMMGAGRLMGASAGGPRAMGMVAGGAGGAILIHFAPDFIGWFAS